MARCAAMGRTHRASRSMNEHECTQGQRQCHPPRVGTSGRMHQRLGWIQTRGSILSIRLLLVLIAIFHRIGWVMVVLWVHPISALTAPAKARAVYPQLQAAFVPFIDHHDNDNHDEANLSLFSVSKQSPYWNPSQQQHQQQQTDGVTSSSSLEELQRLCISQIRQQRYEAALQSISEMVRRLRLQQQQQQGIPSAQPSRNTTINLAAALDQAVQTLTIQSFQGTMDAIAGAPQGEQLRRQRRRRQPILLDQPDMKRIGMGLVAIQWQLACSQEKLKLLPAPYDCLPYPTLLQALYAATTLIRQPAEILMLMEDWIVERLGKSPLSASPQSVSSTTTSNRSWSSASSSVEILVKIILGLLQQIASGEVRHSVSRVEEKVFSHVLDSLTCADRMDAAECVVVIQDQSPLAPPLSAVAYSILLKGYGRRGDKKGVDATVQRMKQQPQLVPDTILMNSLMDAYINCNQLTKAKAVFCQMKEQGTIREDIATSNDRAVNTVAWPRPNGRTYNTLLKGFAKIGNVEEALRLSHEMETLGMIDAVTINTVVHAAVVAGNLTLAEAYLEEKAFKYDSLHPTLRDRDHHHHRHHHPHVEAYTELLDGCTKAGQIDRAIMLFKLMRQRSVPTNEYTYSCLIGGLARRQKLDQAKEMIQFMSRDGLRPTVVSYNALISGIMSVDKTAAESDGSLAMANRNVDQAMEVVSMMIQANVRPNTITAGTIVEGLGRCGPRRVREAAHMVEKWEHERLIPASSTKVLTALVQAYGQVRDGRGAYETFRRIRLPDTTAVNAFMNACTRCDRNRMAFDTFNYYFRTRRAGHPILPDVISYSVLIVAALRSSTLESIRLSASLYDEMTLRKIDADIPLIDAILKAIVRISRMKSLSRRDMAFVGSLLHDAEKLPWQAGQLERRKRAIRVVLNDRLRDLCREGSEIADLLAFGSLGNDDDELFQRKGWNKVDSSFRLWGGGNDSDGNLGTRGGQVDEFLESHGWNDVDSSFRIF